MVLDVIVRCNCAMAHLPQNNENDSSIWEEAQKLSLDIAASIPYYLSDNLQVFLDRTLASDTMPKLMIPGRPVGGLLSMHTLYKVSKLSVVDPVLKDYLKDCLGWIGRNMGIGQATMLSEVN
jgi:hypothetical protein